VREIYEAMRKNNQKSLFNIGDLIIPKTPLKPTVGMVLSIKYLDEQEQDLEVLLQKSGEVIWVSSFDVELLYDLIK